MNCDNCGHEWDTLVPRMECPECGSIVENTLNYKSPVKEDDNEE